jgi:hypothetical protein
MRRQLWIFVTVLMGMASSLQGKVVEASCFKEISKHVSKDTVVLLDIDDTLLIPCQMLGIDDWFNLRWKKHQAAGLNSEAALEKALAEWESVRHITQMKTVEKDTDAVVQELQKNGHLVMGLTTQGLALATRTVQQLTQNKIDLSVTAPTKEDCYVNLSGKSVLFRKGVLFTSASHKGEAFFKFCDSVGLKPKKVVFINDKATHLVEIEKTAEERGVEFVGLRYAYADKHKAAFRADIAELQFKQSSFDRILSDEEAEAKLIAQTSALQSGDSVKRVVTD